ncbi:hypothetical protein COCOBI_06-0160 [Coccomyxa sp. Obi]|nr:hypothetical protein COCOBI_06-0160 [Coccomyxa sp. Obi]
MFSTRLLTSIRATCKQRRALPGVTDCSMTCSTRADSSESVGTILQAHVEQPNSQVSSSYHPTQPSMSEGHMMGVLIGYHRQHAFSTSTAAAAVRKKGTPQPSGKKSASGTNTLAPASTSGSEVANPADPWTEVVHKETGQIYYWNQQTDETTALGEPKPGPQGRMQYPPQTINRGTSLLGLVGVGAGVGLVFAILGRLM